MKGVASLVARATPLGAGDMAMSSQTLALLVASAFTIVLFFMATHGSKQEIGLPSPPLTLHHESGLALSFEPSNGLFVASNDSKPARFRLVDVSRALVVRLYEQREQAERAAARIGLNGISVKTQSGCTCSGFSNEHGLCATPLARTPHTPAYPGRLLCQIAVR